MVAQTRHGAHPAKKRLTFQGQLAGKGVTTDALLKKLTSLHTQLAALEQETVEVNSLNTVRSELIHTSLLLHKDRGVKAYAACCLADILRLYAPEAPYTQHELRDIFQFFFRQLSAGFKGHDEPYYNEYFHLLESLSTVKSVVLVCDLPTADEMLHDIFREMFVIVKRDFTKKVEMFMADILVALIDECNSLPNDVLEIVMAQFMEKNAKIEQPGYRLAVQVCNAASDKLQRHVCQYFGDILTSSEDGDEDLDNMRKSHELVKRLHHSCSSVLHSVIPILETELRSDNINARLIATQILGEMYADKGGPDLVKNYPSTWQAWINRKADVAVSVRLKCVEATTSLLPNLLDSREALEELLNQKLFDPDEKVRTATCKVFSGLDYEAALHHVSQPLLRALTGRGMDKKRSVRVEALTSAAKLFNLAYPEIENNDAQAITQFAWIPDEIIQMVTGGVDVRNLVEQILFEYIVPLPSITTSSATKEKEVDESAWTDRLLTIMRYLSEKAIKNLIHVGGLVAIRPNVFDHYLEACIQNNGGIIDQNEDAVIARLKIAIRHAAGTFGDPVKASEDLESFAKLNENRLYKLLRTCMDPQTDLKGLIKANNEFLKRTEQVSSSIVQTMTALILRSSYRLVNQSSVPTLLKRIEKGQGTTNAKAHHASANALVLLTAVSKNCPALYKSHIGELTKATADEQKSTLVEVAMQALANVVKWDEKLAPTDKKTTERVMRIALDDNWRQAKFAARYLAFNKNKEEVCSMLVESISKSAGSKKSVLPVAHIAALVQIARFAPDAFEQKSDVIVGHLIKRILMVPSPVPTDDEDPEEEWVDNDEMSDELRAKILSLKVCRNRCLAYATSEQALEIATPVLKLLVTLIDYDGSLHPNTEEHIKAKSRLRLQAAVSLLHLSTVDTFATAISPKFIRLACIIQDPCFNVRQAFLQKLVILLQSRKLPARYNVIPFLTVLDPEPENKNLASSYVLTVKRRMSPAASLENLELMFIRLLHLLAHHPDFATTQDELLDMASYVQFYLELIATSENVSLLYHLASKGKTVRDPESHTYSENFYVMCEIAQILIKARAQAHSWLLPSYPGKVKLPSDILRPLPNAEATNQIIKTVYIPSEANDWLIERFKLGGYKEKKEKEKREKEKRVPAKRKATPKKTNGTSKRPRKKREAESDDEAEDHAESSDIEMGDETSSPNGRGRKSDVSEEGVKQSRAERLSARTRAKEKLERAETPSSEGE